MATTAVGAQTEQRKRGDNETLHMFTHHTLLTQHCTTPQAIGR